MTSTLALLIVMTLGANGEILKQIEEPMPNMSVCVHAAKEYVYNPSTGGGMQSDYNNALGSYVDMLKKEGRKVDVEVPRTRTRWECLEAVVPFTDKLTAYVVENGKENEPGEGIIRTVVHDNPFGDMRKCEIGARMMMQKYLVDTGMRNNTHLIVKCEWRTDSAIDVQDSDGQSYQTDRMMAD